MVDYQRAKSLDSLDNQIILTSGSEILYQFLDVLFFPIIYSVS